MPDILRRSTLRTALRQQEAAGELLSFQPGGWIELATVEGEDSPFPEAERLTLERLEWLAQAINDCPECPAIRSNFGSPDPTVGAHEARALPPRGFIAEAKIAGPFLWGRAVQIVKDGVGLVADAIENGFCRGSLGFLAGNDPEAEHGWSVDHFALLGSETSGQRMLGVPTFDASIFRARLGSDGTELEVSTRALSFLALEDEPEPAEPAAEGGSAAQEGWTMTPEEMAAFMDQIRGVIKEEVAACMGERATPEPTAEERAAADVAATEAAERATAWGAEVESRLDRAMMELKLQAPDRKTFERDLKALGREKGEPTLREIEQRTPKARPEPLSTAHLSARSRPVLEHLGGARIDETNVARSLSYVAIREQLGIPPGPLTATQAQQILAIRAREQEAAA